MNSLTFFLRRHRKIFFGLLIIALPSIPLLIDVQKALEASECLASLNAAKTYPGCLSPLSVMPDAPGLWAQQQVTVNAYLEVIENQDLSAVGIENPVRNKPGRILFTTKKGVNAFVLDDIRGTLAAKTIDKVDKSVPVLFLEGNGFEVVSKLIEGLFTLAFLGLLAYQIFPNIFSGFQVITRHATRFRDVIGANEAKQGFKDIVAYLKNPEIFHAMGVKPPKGILLSGPPGTGKTLLAKALAGECNVPFIACSGADFSSSYVGVGILKVKHLFRKARRQGLCIVYIDEFDGIGQRTGNSDAASAENNRIINQLLVEMDGFQGSKSHVIVIGATNFPDQIDPALCREGRMDRRVALSLPTLDERVSLFELYSASLITDVDLDNKKLARLTVGMAPAAIAGICNLAGQIAARTEATVISMAHFLEALEITQLGAVNGTVLSENDRYRTAVHEAGHAVIAAILNAGRVEKVTIVPRGDALGVTFLSQSEDKKHLTEECLSNRVRMLLGGRAAEQLLLGAPSVGAAHDLEEASRIVTDMTTKFGFGNGLVVHKGNLPDSVTDQIRIMLDDCYRSTYNILESNLTVLDRVVSELLDKETISGDEIFEFVDEKTVSCQ